ncbi:MAG: hypothetical protein CMJ59_01825 [Planctomycetaceae bacterium]|nr:hypothetical protein [Planctomycetaceae bacterium]
MNLSHALCRPRTGEHLLRGAALATLFSLLALAGFLGLRRWRGALVALPPTPMLAGVALALLALALVRLLVRQARSGESYWHGDLISRVLAPLAAVGLTVALCGFPGWPNLACWGLVGVSELAWAASAVRHGFSRRHPQPSRSERVPTLSAEGEAQAALAPPIGTGLPTGVFQHSTRSRRGDGGETLETLCRSLFPPEEKLQTVHLAFCPPLEDAPRLDVEQLSGRAAALKIAEARTYGARIEVRLETASDQPQEVLIRIRGETA